jgi:hypothetical protein
MSIKYDVYTIKLNKKVNAAVRNHLSRTSLSLLSTPDVQYSPAKVGQTFTANDIHSYAPGAKLKNVWQKGHLLGLEPGPSGASAALCATKLWRFIEEKPEF